MGRLGLRYWPLTIATTAGVFLLATVGVVAFGFARFTAPQQPWLADVLALCTAGPVLAFAEEIGWRGYLQPRLAFLGERNGQVWIDSGYVFTRKDGEPINPSYATTRFRKLTDRAGLPQVRLHDLRRGAASRTHEAGADLKTLQDLLGHSSIVVAADLHQ